MVFSVVYPESRATVTAVSVRSICITLKRNPILISSHSPFLIPSSSCQLLTLLRFSIHFLLLDISYKWNQIIQSLCLASFTEHVFKVFLSVFLSFLWPNNTLWFEYTTLVICVLFDRYPLIGNHLGCCDYYK